MEAKKWMKILFCGVATLAIAVAVTSFAGTADAKNSKDGNSNNIGYVDVSKLQAELPDYQNLQEVMKEKEAGYKYFQGYLLSQQRTAAKEIQDKATAQKNGKNADEQAKIDSQAQADLKKKSDELNDQLDKERNKIMQELNDIKSKADDKTKSLIADVAADEKLTVVFDKSAVLFGGTDITDKVIAKAKKDQKDAKDNKDTKDTKETKDASQK